MASSTSGYIPEIGSPHERHFALSHIHPNTGTLSYHLMGVMQRGHREPGATIDKSSGIRAIHTFRKLPITNPNKKMKAITKVCARPVPLLCTLPHRPPALNVPAPSQCPMPNAYLSGLCAPCGELFFLGFLAAPIL